MYTAYSSIRRVLTEDSAVSSQVSSSDIRVGYSLTLESYPCVTIQKIGGGTYGLLGFGTSPAGSKNRWEDRLFQIDIFSQVSIEELELIADNVMKALISGCSGARMLSDAGGYDDGYQAWRSIQTWSMWDLVQD